MSIISLPADELAASVFVPSLDELEAYDQSLEKGQGCKLVVVWMQETGDKIIESYCQDWWKLCNVKQSVRNNILSKRFKRIQEMYSIVKESMGMNTHNAAGLRRHGATVDCQLSLSHPKMKLSTWLDLQISAASTVSTAEEWKKLIVLSHSSRSNEWKREAHSLTKQLDTVINSARSLSRVVAVEAPAAREPVDPPSPPPPPPPTLPHPPTQTLIYQSLINLSMILNLSLFGDVTWNIHTLSR